MPEPQNRLRDELAKLMTDAAGGAQGMKREAEGLFRSGAERVMRDMDFVTREEFLAVKEMAANARAEADALKARVEALEAKLGEAK